MIPVLPQPEPDDFSERVRRPGAAFLGAFSHPTTGAWKGKEFWRRVLPDMREVYGGVCAYSAHWISPVTGGHSVDHFIPKVLDPQLAYEWSNFRYVCSKFNARKGTRTILDPFRLEPDWFIIDFDSFLVKPSPDLTQEQQAVVRATIEVLKLNDDEGCVELREECVLALRNGDISFSHLQKRAPFIAYELQRQHMCWTMISG